MSLDPHIAAIVPIANRRAEQAIKRCLWSYPLSHLSLGDLLAVMWLRGVLDARDALVKDQEADA